MDVVDDIPGLAWIIDIDGGTITPNQRAREFLGFGPGEVFPSDPTFNVVPDQKPMIVSDLQTAFADRTITTVVRSIYLRDGTEVELTAARWVGYHEGREVVFCVVDDRPELERRIAARDAEIAELRERLAVIGDVVGGYERPTDAR